MDKMVVIEDNFQQIIPGAGLRPEFSDSYISQYIPTTLQWIFHIEIHFCCEVLQPINWYLHKWNN